MKRYIEFTVETRPFNPDILTGILWELDLTGITEDDNKLVLYSEESRGITLSSVEEKLKSMVAGNLIKTFNVTEKSFEDKNWNEAWEKQLEIIEVTKNIVIKPPGKQFNPGKNQIVITIEPKMSFGTGEHETTKLVLKLLEKHIQKGDLVLDFGSGTGILSIAAAKMGAGKVIGIDNDEWCLLNGLENITINNVQDKVNVREAELADILENNFDLITANINMNILLENSAGLYKKLKKNGTLILSGLLLDDEEIIKNEYESKSFEYIETISLGEWIALVLRKTS